MRSPAEARELAVEQAGLIEQRNHDLAAAEMLRGLLAKGDATAETTWHMRQRLKEYDQQVTTLNGLIDFNEQLDEAAGHRELVDGALQAAGGQRGGVDDVGPSVFAG